MKFLKLPLQILHPLSANEDDARHEYILNIFTASMVFFMFVAACIQVTVYVFFFNANDWKNNSVPIAVLFIFFQYFLTLFALTKKGFARLSAWSLLATIYVLATYVGMRWGVEAHASVLFFVVLIVMTGILIGTRAAFVTTTIVSATGFVIGYLQISGIIHPNLYWRGVPLAMVDIIAFVSIYYIIVIVSWLSNREIERSLARARRSEAELKKERDMLEVRVEERTKELRAVEMENMRQSYRFVEFGRLASGLIHDLSNPLAALSLNIENMSRSHASVKGSGDSFTALAADIERAKRATDHMARLTESMRKHLASEGTNQIFSLREVSEGVVEVLGSYARPRRVTITLRADEVSTYGDPSTFAQVLSNLISNAIESFDYGTRENDRLVNISIAKNGSEASVVVEDNGPGIAQEIANKIFEPFFTTKSGKNGLGIGLALTKRVIENDFHGRISVEKVAHGGTRFMVSLPIREP